MTRQTIVITGASDGIGAAAARELSRQGAEVVLVGRSPAKTAALAAELGAPSYTSDFADLSDVRRLADELGVAASVYLGDDVTDEDGFRALTGEHDVTIKIGGGSTEARHRVPDTVGAVAVLGRLADLLA